MSASMNTSRKASELRLKVVGKNHSQSAFKSRFSKDPQNQQASQKSIMILDDNNHEMHPGQEYPTDDFKKQEVKVNVSSRFKTKKRKYSQIQDPRESYFSHCKLLVVEKMLFLLTVLIFFISIVKTEMDQINKGQPSSTTQLMNIISACTVVLELLIVVRYIFLFQLEVDQKKIYHIKNEDESVLLAFLKKSGRLNYLFMELVLVFPHPISLLDGQQVKIYQTFGLDYFDNQTFLIHKVNDFLSILLLIKIYIILRSLVNITIFSSPRASRLCNQNAFEHSFLFTVKCILNEYPLRAISIVFLICVTAFGNALKLSEGMLSYYNTINNGGSTLTGFQTSENCYWCAFITMGTIGYGDYFPKTIPGRLIAITAAITGVLLSSLLIVSLTAYLTMTPSEVRAHTNQLRLDQHKQLEKQAAAALIDTIKVSRLLSERSLGNNTLSQMKPLFNSLKKKIDLSKTRHRKLKSIVNSNNITEEMIKSFELIKDQFRDIYMSQKKLKQTLQRMEDGNCLRLGNIKQSFVNQIQKGLMNSKIFETQKRV